MRQWRHGIAGRVVDADAMQVAHMGEAARLPFVGRDQASQPFHHSPYMRIVRPGGRTVLGWPPIPKIGISSQLHKTLPFGEPAPSAPKKGIQQLLTRPLAPPSPAGIVSRPREGLMARTTTRFVRTKKIADSGIASVLARLMMIVNDIGIVNELSTVWSKSEDKRWKARRGGGRVLLSRVLMSYTYRGPVGHQGDTGQPGAHGRGREVQRTDAEMLRGREGVPRYRRLQEGAGQVPKQRGLPGQGGDPLHLRGAEGQGHWPRVGRNRGARLRHGREAHGVRGLFRWERTNYEPR